jgi:hypothetical protein
VGAKTTKGEMGISLPTPQVVEFGELQKAQKKKYPGDTKGSKEGEIEKTEEPKKRKSILGQPVKPDSRTVFANDPAANSAFKFGVRSCLSVPYT